MSNENISLRECYLDNENNTYHVMMPDKNNKKTDHSYSTFSLQGNGIINARLLSTEGNLLRFSLDGNALTEIKEARIIAAGINLHTLYFFDIELTGSEFSIDISAIKQEAELKKTKNFNLLFECIQAGQYHLYSLHSVQETAGHSPGRKSSLQAISARICESGIFLEDEETHQKTEYILGIYSLQNDNSFRVVICDREYYISIDHVCNITSFKMKKSRLRLGIEVELGNYKLVEIIFSYRCKLAEDATDYPFHIEKQKNKGHFLYLTVSLDLDQITLKSLYWDVILKIQGEDGTEYRLRPVIYRTTKFSSSYYAAAYRTDNGFFLYPYSTGKRHLAFQYREENPYDSLLLPLKEAVALALYLLFKPYWNRKHICLVYEKFCTMAQDNGYYFFKYCMEHPEDTSSAHKIFYVIAKDSPDRKRLEKYENNLIDFVSIRHMIYLLSADVMVSTDAKAHAYIFRCRTSLIKKYAQKRKLVFLQHGVTALKQVDFFYGKGKSGQCDLFIVTSDYEKDIVEKYFGYSENEIANTGFARWDVLEDKSQGSRDVLIMPSWRNWLDEVPNEDFLASDYFRYYMQLLNSQRLQDILEKYDLKLNFYLHSKFREFIHDFSAKSNRMRLIAFGEVPVNEMLMKCRILVTDYSSVCWDVFYQSKPVLFYQFDLDKYEEAHGSYLDMRKDLFGERTEQVDTLLDYLEEYAANDFQLKPEYAAMHKSYFKYTDDQNSKRIWEAMEKQLLKK